MLSLAKVSFKLFINQVVFSEFLFYYIATLGNKSPLSITLNR